MTTTLPISAPRADERAARVEALRRRVQAGEYRVDAPAVAEAVMRALFQSESSASAAAADVPVAA